jgi:hypothetical protein
MLSTWITGRAVSSSWVRRALPRWPSVSAPRALHVDRAQEVGAGEKVGGRAGELDLALLHEHRSRCDRQRDVDRLLDHDDRHAAVMDATHDLEQLPDHRRGQAERQLVDHQQLWLHEEGLRQREHLLFAAGEQRGVVVKPRPQDWEDLVHLGQVGARRGRVG